MGIVSKAVQIHPTEMMRRPLLLLLLLLSLSLNVA
jgi:hypothetical protein